MADGDIDRARASIIFCPFDDNRVDTCLFVCALFHIRIAERVVGRLNQFFTITVDSGRGFLYFAVVCYSEVIRRNIMVGDRFWQNIEGNGFRPCIISLAFYCNRWHFFRRGIHVLVIFIRDGVILTLDKLN